MKKNVCMYAMLVSNITNNQLTPVECEMQRKFLQGEAPFTK